MQRLCPAGLVVACAAAIATACAQKPHSFRAGDGGTDADSDSDTDTDADSDTDTDPEYPKPCADLYDQDILPTFELEIEPVEWAALQDDCVS